MYANRDSPSRRPLMDRFPFARNAKHVDMNAAMVALDIIIRPSLRLWKVGLGRSALAAFEWPRRTTVLLDENTSSTSSITPKKQVRFDEKPVTISRRGFFGRWRRNSGPSSPARPCLVVRDAPHEELETEPDEADSVYEDCLSDHPGILVDLHVPEDTRSLRRVRRSEFYEMESGVAMFDRTSYANYCLSRWLEKQREVTRAPRRHASEDPGALVSRWPSRCTLPLPPLSVPPTICRSPLSLAWRACKYVEDELQNAIVVLVVGLFIHLCLFFLLLYDICVRGLVPSND